ncbi:DEKNAAC103342 [Brettanomyces naardenensis]|uniref:DEKNAAC103342 n=1 Tax=Brettanomyces naardenensis TaxID=13370 RepID=A0A448YNR8_BRENA|nr:DEKNAAC103342 [Brettanomyces naardenensis]
MSSENRASSFDASSRYVEPEEDTLAVAGEEIQSYLNMGRQKLREAVNATKGSRYYKRVAQRFSGDSNTTKEDPAVPNNAVIQIYKTYSREIEQSKYITSIAGIIFTPGVMSRKNRMMVSLAKRMSRTRAPRSAADQFEEEFSDVIEHPEAKDRDQATEFDDDSMSSSSSHLPLDTTTENIVTQRMSGVTASSIPGTLLRIKVGSRFETANIITSDMYTDQYGMFTMDITTEYTPSHVEVSSMKNLDIIQLQEIEPVPLRGLSVISDVDDTVRVTGVLGDKLDIFRNIFSRPYSDCEVQGVPKWFQILNQHFDCAIHYVSNSPWQVYNIVSGFLDYENMPVTSIHLKQYFGNIFSSVRMDPSERKRTVLERIMRDFPERKFVLLGDSGERDMEAYVSLIQQFGHQILAIYIRALPESFSSLGLDIENARKLQEMLDERKKNGESEVPMSNEESKTDIIPEDMSQGPQISERLLSKRKVPPLVPPKPRELRAEPINSAKKARVPRSVSLDAAPPPLPARRGIGQSTSDLDSSRRHRIAWLNSSPLLNEDSELGLREEIPSASSTQSLPAISGLEVVDQKFLNWKERIGEVVNVLPPEIELRFWWKPEDVMDNCFEILSKN